MLIKKYRMEQGLSIPELSEQTGLSRRTLQDIEKRNACNSENLIRISVALGISLDALCQDDISKIKND